MQLGMIGLGRMGANMCRRLMGAGATEEHGYLHCGASGAGHFVKMVHNGIEYGIMAAYAEGLNILHHANIDTGVPAPVLSAALYERFSSRGESGFADKLLSAMRSEFGGHAEQAPKWGRR